MLVKAKCTARAWDSKTATAFYPGEVYEIEHDSNLATLKVGPHWVFEFDRTMSGTGASPAIGGFVCKGCNKTFDTLNELGTHTREQHRNDFNSAITAPEEDGEDEPIPIREDGRKKKGRTFTCKTCGEILPNLYALRVHNKTHKTVEVAETKAVPA